MKRGLFRREAIESRRQIWLGEIQLARPLSLALLTAAVAVIVLGIILFLGWGEYTRKTRISGMLVPDRGVMRLLAPQPALVLERLAVEGQAVKRGQPLFVLSVDQTSSRGDTQAAVQRSLRTRERSLQGEAQRQNELLEAQRVALDRRIADMRTALAAMAGEEAVQRRRLELAQQALARLESLRSNNFVSSAQVQAKAEEVLAVQAQMQSLARQRAAHDSEIAMLQAQLRELPLRSQVRQGEIERDLAELAQVVAESEARRRIVIAAPADGLLGAVLAEPGQTMPAAATLATLLPAGATLQAQLFAPSSAVGFVRPQQPVLLRYQAFPYQKFGHQRGHVLQVSRAPLGAGELGVPATEPMYRITVALDQQSVMAYGQAQPLVPGMQLEADVLLDRRRLIEWIFEPVLGLVGRI